jgi:hypothetical protein
MAQAISNNQKTMVTHQREDRSSCSASVNPKRLSVCLPLLTLAVLFIVLSTTDRGFTFFNRNVSAKMPRNKGIQFNQKFYYRKQNLLLNRITKTTGMEDAFKKTRNQFLICFRLRLKTHQQRRVQNDAFLLIEGAQFFSYPLLNK